MRARNALLAESGGGRAAAPGIVLQNDRIWVCNTDRATDLPATPNGGYRTSVLSRPSQRVTVVAVAGQSVMRDSAGCGDRRPELSQGGESNGSAHQALPNRAHGALLLHHQITRSLTPPGPSTAAANMNVAREAAASVVLPDGT